MTGFSEPTEALRSLLDAAGVPWRDETDDVEGPYRMRIERTVAATADGDVSCVWGWHRLGDDDRRGLTYGYPGMVEVWLRPSPTEPAPMTPREAAAMIERMWLRSHRAKRVREVVCCDDCAHARWIGDTVWCFKSGQRPRSSGWFCADGVPKEGGEDGGR